MRFRRPLIWLLMIGIALAGSASAQAPGEADAESVDTLKARPYFADFDPAIPSQALFEDWPPDAIRQRPYPVPWSYLSFQRASMFARPLLFVLTVDSNRAAKRMEREVLLDPEVMEAINRDYLLIRVNADRRPDLRERYQTGTWPVIHFLLPTGDPMISEFQDEERRRPITTGAVDKETMLFLLAEGKKYWDKWNVSLMNHGQMWAAAESETPPTPGDVDASVSDDLARWMRGDANRRDGGFGMAPKYLHPSFLEFATLRDERGFDDALDHAILSLDKIVTSPLFDSVEGGLHRIATLPSWQGIQYEKRLSTQAALLRELLLATGVEPRAEWKTAVERTVQFILEQLQHPSGGFSVGQAADSSSEQDGGYWLAETRDPQKAPPVEPLVLSGPTALAATEILRAGIVFERDDWTRAGLTTLRFVRDNAVREGRGAIHELAPQPNSRIFLTAQADVALAFLDAYRLTGDSTFLTSAQSLVDFALANLRAPGESLFRDSVEEPRAVGLLRNPRRPFRENARMARALIQLSYLFDQASYRADAVQVLRAFMGSLVGFRGFSFEGAVPLEMLVREPTIVTLHGSGELSAQARERIVKSSLAWYVIRTRADSPQTYVEWKRGDVAKRIDSIEGVAKMLAAQEGA